MPLKDLIELMEPPAQPVDPEGDWLAVEAALSTPLPQEYKSFIAIYGSGSINGFLSIFNPFAQDEDLNLLLQIEVSRRETEVVREKYAALHPPCPLLYGLYPPLGGHLPWGRTPHPPWARDDPGAGRWLDWVTSEAPPEDWVVAHRIHNGYGMSSDPFVDFLLGLLSDRFFVFAEMQPWPEPVFVPSGTEPPRRWKRGKSGGTAPSPPPAGQPEQGPAVGIRAVRTLPSALSAAFPEVEVRTAVRLNPRPAPTTIGASKLGGELLWPATEPWPRCPDHDDTLAAVLQLRAVDVPEVGFPAGQDLFQLLWCPQTHEDHGFGPLVGAFWRTAAEVTDVVATPEAVTHLPGFLPSECRIAPDRFDELPPLWVQGDPTCARLNAWLADHWQQLWPPGAAEPPRSSDEDPYVGEVAASPVSKVGGHPSWIQGPAGTTCSCGREMEHLLSIASEETDPSGWRSGGGTADEPQPLAPFDAALGGPSPWAFSPTGLMLGDMGRVYVLICRHCDGWPVASVLQMT